MRPASFDAKVLSYVPLLRAYARTVTPNEECADLVQDTIVKALDCWTNFRGDPYAPRSGFAKWLKFAMRGIASNKRLRKKPDVVDGYDIALLGATPTQEDAADLSAAVTSLRANPFGITLAMSAAGYSNQEIAAVEGVTNQAISLRVIGARDDLMNRRDGSQRYTKDMARPKRGRRVTA